MTRYLADKLLRAFLTVLFAVTVVFVGTRISGDPTDWLLPDDASAQERQQLREYWAIDESLPIQYLAFLREAVKGNMGMSYKHQRPVTEVYSERIGATLTLGLAALTLAVLVGLPLGILAAVRRNTLYDRLFMSISVVGYTIPNFILGIGLIFFLSLILHIFPSGGYGGFPNLVMPALALSVGPAASIARLVRSSMLDVLHQDYIVTARAKGVGEFSVLFQHALRNGIIPVVTIIGLQIGELIGGSVVVETVFAWPGIGQLIVNAAQFRDFPMIQYGVLLITFTVVCANILVDFLYVLLDPRIRLR